MKRVSCKTVLAHIESVEKEPHHKARSHRAEAGLPYDFCKLTWTRQTVNIDPTSKSRSKGMHVEPHSPARVDSYAKKIAAGSEPPPVVLVDRKFWYEITDGAHRIAAARTAGKKQITAFVGKPRR